MANFSQQLPKYDVNLPLSNRELVHLDNLLSVAIVSLDKIF